MTAALVAESIEVRRGGAAVVSDATIEARAGTIVALLGPSGAGKTSLFRALVGEELPQKGRVLIGGVDVTREPLFRRARRGLGYLPQGPSALHDLTVRENAATFASIVGCARAEVEVLIDELDLRGRADVRARDLSGGERRRLELLRALSAKPRVLVCDEPFGGVDPIGSERLGNLLRSIADTRGVAILIADHHVAELLAIADEAMLLFEGAIVARGAPSAFVEDPEVRLRYLGAWGTTEQRALRPVRDALATALRAP